MSEEWNEIDLNPALPQKEKVEFEVEGQEENKPVALDRDWETYDYANKLYLN